MDFPYIYEHFGDIKIRIFGVAPPPFTMGVRIINRVKYNSLNINTPKFFFVIFKMFIKKSESPFCGSKNKNVL